MMTAAPRHGSGSSSEMMVTVPWPSEIVALVGSDRLTVKVWGDSMNGSSSISMGISAVVSPERRSAG